MPAFIELDDESFVPVENVRKSPSLQASAVRAVRSQWEVFYQDNRYLLELVDPEAASLVKGLGARLKKVAAKLASFDKLKLPG